MKCEVYPKMARRSRRWHWRLVAANGQVVARSGCAGYTRRCDAKRGFGRVAAGLNGWGDPVWTDIED